MQFFLSVQGFKVVATDFFCSVKKIALFNIQGSEGIRHLDNEIQNHGKWNADENNQLKSLDTLTLYRPIISQSRASKVYIPANKRKCL